MSSEIPMPLHVYLQRKEVVTTKLQLKRLAKKMMGLQEFAYDTETNTLRVNGPNKDFRCIGISISWGDYNNYYIPLNHAFDEDQLEQRYVVKILKPVFERLKVRIIGANIN